MQQPTDKRNLIHSVTRRGFLEAAAVASGTVVLPRLGIGAEGDRQKIEAVIPAKAPAVPQKPRKLLIFDLNVDYGGHGSIPTANMAFELMGRKTGAFETVVSRDPSVFKKESLRQFDAVFLNNTVGNLFEDPGFRQNLVEFVYGGGGLMGVHGTSVAFVRWKQGGKEDWPEFAVMLGMRGAHHRANTEKVFIKVEEPAHPVARCLGAQSFEFSDEFFRPKGSYSRGRDRVLLSIDKDKTDLSNEPHDGCYREDKDYALSWVRQYGRGRIFYTAFGHNPHVFMDPKMLEFYLAATQFVLGDLPAPTIPSGKLTPAIRAQEKLGWKLGVEAYTFHKYTFFEAIEKTADLGLAYIGGLGSQKVSKDIPKVLGPELTDDELREVRLKLDSAGIRLVTYYIENIPGDELECRKVFEFGRKTGVEVFVSEPSVESLPVIDRFCEEYGISLALHNHDQKASPNYWNPEAILKACDGRSRRIGACPDLGYWMRAGLDPVKCINVLKDRVVTIHMHDLHELSPQGHDVPWGTGAGRSGDFIREMHRLGIRPAMMGIEHAYNWLESVPEIRKSVEFFDKLSIELA
jgi:sugar phosphate isomerase/epimerase/type 1 glutamine amidotransferase